MLILWYIFNKKSISFPKVVFLLKSLLGKNYKNKILKRLNHIWSFRGHAKYFVWFILNFDFKNSLSIHLLCSFNFPFLCKVANFLIWICWITFHAIIEFQATCKSITEATDPISTQEKMKTKKIRLVLFRLSYIRRICVSQACCQLVTSIWLLSLG